MMAQRRRLMAMCERLEPLVIYENGVLFAGGSVTDSIITNKNGAKGGVDPAYCVAGEWTGIRCFIDSSGTAGASGICAFTTGQKITLPEGYSKLNALLISRDHYSTPSRGCVGLNLWKAAGAYYENSVFEPKKLPDANTVYTAECAEAGSVITLTDDAPEIKTAYSTNADDSGNLPVYQISRVSSGKIDAGEYYIGGYVRRTASYTGGSNGNSIVIRKLWLT